MQLALEYTDTAAHQHHHSCHGCTHCGYTASGLRLCDAPTRPATTADQLRHIIYHRYPLMPESSGMRRMMRRMMRPLLPLALPPLLTSRPNGTADQPRHPYHRYHLMP